MQSPTWAELVTELTARGYRHVFHIELACRVHGDWRAACLADSEFLPTCPRCGEVSDATILARGLTRTEVPWRLVSPALPEAWKIDRTEGESNSRYARVASRKRCEKFFARARVELAGIR